MIDIGGACGVGGSAGSVSRSLLSLVLSMYSCSFVGSMGLVVPGIGMLFGSGNPVSGLCADDEADDVAVAASGVVVAGVAASVSVGPMEVLTDCGSMKSVLKRPSPLGCAGVPFRELKILKFYFSVGGSRLMPNFEATF